MERKEGKEGEEVTCLVAKAERDRRRNEEEEKEEEEGERVCFFPLFIYLRGFGGIKGKV